MNDMDPLYDALRKADTAGNTEDAQKLADYIRSQSSSVRRQVSFDVAGAMKAGYSAAEIADHLGQQSSFDVGGARKAGYTDNEIINHLAGTKPSEGAQTPDEPSATKLFSEGDDGKGVLGKVLNEDVGVNEAALNVATGTVATPIAGIAGVVQGAYNSLPEGAQILGKGPSAADRVQQMQGAMTYEPRTDAGKRDLDVITKPLQLIAQGADKAGQVTADATGSPLVGAGVNTALQAIPAVLLKKAAALRAGGTAGQAAAADATARQYVSANGMDWNRLPAQLQQQLTAVATDGTDLNKLDPAAIKRQAQLQSLDVPVPATRGQLTRDRVQLRNEGNASATNAGSPINDIHNAQNQALLDNLDKLKGDVSGTGPTQATASTAQQTGASIQEAARAKLAAQQAKVSQLYKAAQDSGETDAKVDVTPLHDLIRKTPDQSHYGYAKSWLDQNTDGPGGGVSISDLEDLRQAASARAMNGGADAFYARKLMDSIDQTTSGAGGDLYKAARTARRAQGMEFQDQGAVADLVDNTSRTDRATALESTTKQIINGSIEDVQKVKRTLLNADDPDIQAKGQKAWNDLRAQVVQDIKDKATNGVALREDGSPNLTPSTLKKAIDGIGPDKLNEIFGPDSHQKLMNILEATRAIKTLPPSAAVGSSTAANAMAFLEKAITKVPGGGTLASLARGAVKLRDIGAADRAAQYATTTPLSDLAKGAAARQKLGKAKALIPLSMVIRPQQEQQQD